MSVRLSTGCSRTLIVVNGGVETGGFVLHFGAGVRAITNNCTLKMFYVLAW